MAKRTVYHVVPYEPTGFDWAVKKQGASRISSKHRKKSSATRQAKKLAKDRKPSQVKIHDSSGTIQKEHTYVKDPEKYKG